MPAGGLTSHKTEAHHLRGDVRGPHHLVHFPVWNDRGLMQGERS